MDARDFLNTPVPEYEEGKILEKIYELQKQLIDGYVKIEGLPPYPIDVNPKKSQILIKDFVGRVIEELAEGYESLILIDKLCCKNLNFMYNYDDVDLGQCINHLQNVSEEMADAMHFMVELLIYVNIQPDDILKYINKHFSESSLDLIPTKDRSNTIRMAMYYGKSVLTKENDLPTMYTGVNLLRLTDFEYETKSLLYQAGHIYDAELYNDFKKCLWDVAYHLNIARNFLKNKPWKQSQMMTDELNFQREIVEGFIAMMGAFYIIGIDDTTLYAIYFWKHEANLFRQNSKY